MVYDSCMKTQGLWLGFLKELGISHFRLTEKQNSTYHSWPFCKMQTPFLPHAQHEYFILSSLSFLSFSLLQATECSLSNVTSPVPSQQLTKPAKSRAPWKFLEAIKNKHNSVEVKGFISVPSRGQRRVRNIYFYITNSNKLRGRAGAGCSGPTAPLGGAPSPLRSGLRSVSREYFPSLIPRHSSDLVRKARRAAHQGLTLTLEGLNIP